MSLDVFQYPLPTVLEGNPYPTKDQRVLATLYTFVLFAKLVYISCGIRHRVAYTLCHPSNKFTRGLLIPPDSL
jgi:hypothetical protein